MDLKTSLQEAEKALKNLDAAIAEAVNHYEKQAQSKAAEMVEALNLLKLEAEREAEAKAAEHEQEVSKLEEKLKDLEEAEEFFDEVYTFERKGVLDTNSPVKRLVFEKLAERWDSLTNAELDDLEALLDGKLTFL